MAGNSDARNELREIQTKINTKTDESLESTRRMLVMCEESQDVGIKTMDMLHHQGEQLDRIEEGLEQVNEGMNAAEKNLGEMEKCCGLCILPWKRTKRVRVDESMWKPVEGGKLKAEGSRVVAGGEPEQQIQGGFLTRITNDAREDEMEQNLMEVSGMVVNMRSMAVDMNSALNCHNEQLGRISVKTSAVDDRVQKGNVRAEKIVKNA